MIIRTLVKVLFTITTIVALSVPSCAAVNVSEAKGGITMENDALKLNIALESGGRIISLVDKRSGKDVVTAWEGANEYGGMLDDRHDFTALTYGASVMQPGGETGVVRMSAQADNGMSIVKILTLRHDSSTLEVSETFSNGSQKSGSFWVRNFMLPDGGPRTEDTQYFLPVKDKPLQPLTPANAYYPNLSSPWSAVWNSKTGDGILVATPGIKQFYFWQKSAITQTYEWIYPEVPAGKSISVNYAIRLIHSSAPNWATLSAAALKGLDGVRFGDVPNWQNTEQRFGVTSAEHSQGFWLSVGDADGKHRLPKNLRIDVPLNQKRSVYIGFNALREFDSADLNVRFQNIPTEIVQPAWQVESKDSIKVLSFNDTRKIDLKNDTEGRLWLTLQGGAKAMDAKGSIEISLNGKKVVLPLEVKVWPVQVPASQPFEVREYAGFKTFFSGSELTPESLPEANALFKAFHGYGGSMMNWSVNWPGWYRYLKIVDTEETAANWLAKNRAAFADKPASEWPALDFTTFDPYVQAAKTNGVTWAGTYLDFPTKEKPITSEGEWILIQLKKYLEKQGLHGFYCKIADEISEDQVPSFIEAAKVARRAGWLTGTTLSPHTASFINTMNPYCDVWEMGKGDTEFFNDLLTKKYKLEEKTLTMLADKWSTYRNGGAEDTFSQELFNGLIPVDRSEVQRLQVFQDGKQLQSRVGESAWGNKTRGVFTFSGGNGLFLSPLEGTDIKQAKITVKYTVNVPSSSGKVLAKIDPTDKVIIYQASMLPYRVSYGSAASFQLKVIEGDYYGLGWYEFHRWDADKIVWYDKKTGDVSISPAYVGLRDGWNDACLISWLAKNKKVPVSQFISEKPDAPLRIGEVKFGIYQWKDIVNLTDPFVLNTARIKMLEAAVGR